MLNISVSHWTPVLCFSSRASISTISLHVFYTYTHPQASSCRFSKHLGGIRRRWCPELGAWMVMGERKQLQVLVVPSVTAVTSSTLPLHQGGVGGWREFSGEAQAIISFEWLLWYINQWCHVMGMGSQPCIKAPDTQHDASSFWQMKILLKGRHFENLSLERQSKA